jgi:GNAT superfamily N-acetyltransferase
MHPEIERIDEHFAAFWVAVENAGAEDVVVGITGIDEVRDRTSLGMNVPEFIDCGRRLGQLHWVQVAPERWRTGIGRALVGTTIEWVRTRGYEGLILETTAQQTAAIKLYEGLGFKEAGRTMFGQWEQVWMELALA